jgi:hypothetical protein
MVIQFTMLVFDKDRQLLEVDATRCQRSAKLPPVTCLAQTGAAGVAYSKCSDQYA